MKERSRELRQAGNVAEIILWKQLQKRQFLGLRFARQKLVGHYIADFYCHEAKVVIEVDGSSHDDRIEYDTERDEYMSSIGLKVIRVSDKNVENDIDGLLGYLKQEIIPLSQRGWHAL